MSQDSENPVRKRRVPPRKTLETMFAIYEKSLRNLVVENQNLPHGMKDMADYLLDELGKLKEMSLLMSVGGTLEDSEHYVARIESEEGRGVYLLSAETIDEACDKVRASGVLEDVNAATFSIAPLPPEGMDLIGLVGLDKLKFQTALATPVASIGDASPAP